MSRCTRTDLPPEQCAHCRGDTLTGIEPTPRRYQSIGAGRRIWPDLPTTPTPSKPAPEEEPTDDPCVKVARDLRAIGHMAAMLGERALDLADDPHLPGGDAMVNLAPVANLEAWQHQVDTDEQYALAGCRQYAHVAYTSVADEDPDEAWPVFQTLRFWSEDWRRQAGQPDIEAPTIATEARWLGGRIDWAWDREPHFDDFAEDIKAARIKLENIVRDGFRETRSRILCDRCRNPKRLIVKYGKGDRPSTYKAPCCKAELTEDDAKRALAKQLRSEGVEKWVSLAEAVSVLRVQGWSEATVRAWAEAEDVATQRVTSGIRCWWPDLWRCHLIASEERAARQRRREQLRAAKAACEAEHGEDCWQRGRCGERMGA